MGIYLGSIAIRNRYVNFKPLYEYQNGEFYFLNQYDRQALLPESSFGDINFYCEDGRQRVDEMFVSDTYCLLEFETEDLEPNYASSGLRNQTGYKIEISRLESGKIHYLGDINYYYVLSESGFEGSYKTNPTLVITDPYAYQDLEVVIPITEEKNTVIGPFRIEWRDQDNHFVIRTGLETQKYVLHGYRFPTDLKEYKLQVGHYGDERSFIHLDTTVCTEIGIDVITKEQLLASFRSTLNRDTFIDGKIDLENIGELAAAHAESLFVGEELPEDIRENRFDAIRTLLTDEEQLNDTFDFISETITGLLDKYQDSEQYRKMVRDLANDPDFMSRIQRFQIITDRIEAKQKEFDTLAARAAELQQKLDEEKKQEYASDLLGEYDNQINELQAQREQLEMEILDLNDRLNLLQDGADLQKRLTDLSEQVDYKERRERELDTKLKTLNEKISSIFSNSTEKAMSFAFDGMLTSRMLQQAAEWENQQNAINYQSKIRDLKSLTLSLVSQERLIDNLVEKIQRYRPTYDKNAILNILICYTQGFLTVFSGEPGTGKTSICKILASVLGLTVPETAPFKYKDGVSTTRFVLVPVERGWTTKRDFIGYYNPLTKSFDRSNRKIFDALNIMDLEAKGNNTDMPFLILLDEANLSPMEYYWADFMNICDDLGPASVINLGDDFCFNIPEQLRFVATINNDHTTEALSPRLVDRAWIIRLPKVKSGMAQPVMLTDDTEEVVAWSALVSTFGADSQNLSMMSGTAKDIYDDLLNKCRVSKINVSARADAAIRRYWSTAQRLFENDANYGTDASIVALDYAVSQRILTHIDGSGEKYGQQLEDIRKFCSEKNLRVSAEVLSSILKNGEDSMQYYQFFA